MALKAVMDTLDGLPEEIAALYTEKNGKFELTGIHGVKTEADTNRLQEALRKEREQHNATKETYKRWDEFDFDDITAKLDRIPELEAAAKGKLDDAQIEEIVSRRVDGTLQSRTAPLERQLRTLTGERDKLAEEIDALRAEKTQRLVHDAVRAELTKEKVIPEAHEDALFLAERVFEVRADDGAIVTRDNVGVTPGIMASEWLKELQPKRPHWWPASQGGGAGGSAGTGGGAFLGAANPFSHEGWNVTKQGMIIRSQGMEAAERMAKAAGTRVGGTRPPAKK